MALVFGFLVLCPLAVPALSIFPEIKTTMVAASANREVARGIATDGTNFLVVLQGDNLYVTPNQTNQLAACLVGPNGSPMGNRIDFAANGSVPLVQFGTSNFLAAWTENDSGVQLIRGQFVDRLGNLSACGFVIASNTSALEVGAMTFAAGSFLIAWAQTNVTGGTGIALHRVSESGLVADRSIILSSSNSPDERFPVLSASDSNVLVTWTARRAGTNAWDVLGRFVDTMETQGR